MAPPSKSTGFIARTTSYLLGGVLEEANSAVDQKKINFFTDLLKRSPTILVDLHNLAISTSFPFPAKLKVIRDLFNTFSQKTNGRTSPSENGRKVEKEEEHDDFVVLKVETPKTNPTPTPAPTTQAVPEIISKASELTQEEIESISKWIQELEKMDQTDFETKILAFDQFICDLISKKSGILQTTLQQLNSDIFSFNGTLDQFARYLKTTLASAITDPAPTEVVHCVSAFKELIEEYKKGTSPHQEAPKKAASEALSKLMQASMYDSLPITAEQKMVLQKFSEALKRTGNGLEVSEMEKIYQDILLPLQAKTSGLMPRIILSLFETVFKQLNLGMGGATDEKPELIAPPKETPLDKALNKIRTPKANVDEEKRKREKEAREKELKRPVVDRINEQKNLFNQNTVETILGSISLACLSDPSQPQMIDIIESARTQSKSVNEILYQTIQSSSSPSWRKLAAKCTIFFLRRVTEFYVIGFMDSFFTQLQENIPDSKQKSDKALFSSIRCLNDDLSAINDTYRGIAEIKEPLSAALETCVKAHLQAPGYYAAYIPEKIETEFVKKVVDEFTPRTEIRRFLINKLNNLRLSSPSLFAKACNFLLAIITGIISLPIQFIFYIIDKVLSFIIVWTLKHFHIPSYLRTTLRTSGEKAVFDDVYAHTLNKALLENLQQIWDSLEAPPVSSEKVRPKEPNPKIPTEPLPQVVKDALSSLVKHIFELLQNQRLDTHRENRADKSSQAHGNIDTLFKFSALAFGFDPNIVSTASEAAADELASTLAASLKKEKLQELLYDTLKNLNDTLYTKSKAVTEGEMTLTEKDMYDKLYAIVKKTIRLAIEAELNPQIRYQAYADNFVTRLQTKADLFSSEMQKNIDATVRRNLWESFVLELKEMEKVDERNTNSETRAAFESYISSISEILNETIDPLISGIQKQEEIIKSISQQQTHLTNLSANLEALKQPQPDVKKQTEEFQTTLSKLEGLELESIHSSSKTAFTELQKQINLRTSLEQLQFGKRGLQTLIEKASIEDQERTDLKSKTTKEDFDGALNALKEKYALKFGDIDTLVAKISQLNKIAADTLKEANEFLEQRNQELLKSIFALGQTAKALPKIECRSDSLLQKLPADWRPKVKDMIVNIVSSLIHLSLKETPSITKKNYVFGFVLNRSMTRTMVGIDLPVKYIPILKV